MADLTIIANITAHKDKTDLVKAELLKLVPITRSESGCLQYDLHQDNDRLEHFTFVERWASRELWRAHMAAPHLAAYLRAVDGAVAAFEIFEMSALEP